MEILLLVLKIIGIILLVVLGVAFALLLYVLFFPILYKGSFSADKMGEEKNFCGNVKVRILGLVGIYAKVDESGVNAIMKFLWIKKVLFGSNGKSVAEDGGSGAKKKNKNSEAVKTEIANEKLEISEKPESETVNEKIKNSENPEEVTDPNPKTSTAPDKDELEFVEESGSETPDNEIKKGFFERLHAKIETLTDKLLSISTILDEEKKAVELFLKRKSTKYTLEKLKVKTPKLLKHILPKKISGNLCVGFEEPSKTGYLCAVMGMIYGTYGENFDFKADFEEERLEGEISFSGYIIPAYPVFIALSLYLSKKVRLCIRNLKLLYAESTKRLDKVKETMIN